MSDDSQLSHDLRTPLTTLRLVIERLSRKGDALSPETRKDLLATALAETKRLESAIVRAETQSLQAEVEDESNVIVLHEEVVDDGLVRIQGSALKAASRR